MRNRKYHIALDVFERRVVVNCLNEIRNNSKQTIKWNGLVG